MSSLNKVMAIGNLGKDPETRYIPSGMAVTTFSVAVTETWVDKQTGEKKESTEWVRCEVWGKLAEVCSKYLIKGSMVYIEGRMKTDSWNDANSGVTKYATKVKADTVQFLSGTKRADDRPQASASAPQAEVQQKSFDDDIPFAILLPALSVALLAASQAGQAFGLA
jgi:single-strand DNA-binding protein